MPVGRPILQPMARPHKTFSYNQIVRNLVTIVASNVEQFGELVFKLSDLPQLSTFTSLYDRYRITKVEVQFRPSAVQLATDSTANIVPDMATAIDLNSNGTPTSFNQVLEYGTGLLSNATATVVRAFQPCNLLQIYKTGVSTGYATARPWLSCSDSTIPYYGVVWALGSTNATDYNIYVDVRYFISFKDLK